MADPSEVGRPRRRISWAARIIGPLALIAVVIAVIVVVGSSSDAGGDGTNPTGAGAKSSKSKQKSNKDGPETPKTYEVQSGDSLSSIAAKFGLSVKRLERLNPDVDPQALSGELKLR